MVQSLQKEMPSLDVLSVEYPELSIFAVNLEKPNKEKQRVFFDELNVNNLEIFFDPEFKLAKQFKLRGVPSTILLNKDGDEFARIIGEIDFADKNLSNGLKKFM